MQINNKLIVNQSQISAAGSKSNQVAKEEEKDLLQKLNDLDKCSINKANEDELDIFEQGAQKAMQALDEPGGPVDEQPFSWRWWLKRALNIGIYLIAGPWIGGAINFGVDKLIPD